MNIKVYNIAMKLTKKKGTDTDFEMESIIMFMMDSPEEASDKDIIKSIKIMGVPDYRDRDGRTLLINATSYDRNGVAKYLIKHGADVNAAGTDGYTSLHMAADRDNIEIAEMLLKAGADVNARDENGNTPLLVSATLEMVRTLLDFGADPNISNSAGVTPMNAFEASPEAMELLEKFKKE